MNISFLIGSSGTNCLYLSNSLCSLLNSLIDNLIDNNFKRDALKEKFILNNNYKTVKGDTIDIKINELGELTTSDGKPTQFKEKVESNTNYNGKRIW